eukprot:gene12601-26527_t
MDIFYDSDNEDGNETEKGEKSLKSLYHSICFIELMAMKTHYRSSTICKQEDLRVFEDLTILILTLPKGSSIDEYELKIKLQSVSLSNVLVSGLEDFTNDNQFDVIIFPFSDPRHTESGPDANKFELQMVIDKIWTFLIPGGLFLLPLEKKMTVTDCIQNLFDSNRWFTGSSTVREIKTSTSNPIDESSPIFASVSIRRRVILNNDIADTYFQSVDEQVVQSDYSPQRTLSALEDITVACSTAERRLGVLSAASHTKAVAALRDHGVCVLRSLLLAQTVLDWTAVFHQDFNDAMDKLRERNIDLDRPGEGAFINNFYELSMREARRCDFRNGLRVAAYSRDCESSCVDNGTTGTGTAGTGTSQREVTMDKDGHKAFRDLRRHPAVLGILRDVMNPAGDPEDEKGNWGRWNFEGGGPAAGAPPPRSGPVGSIFTLP